MSTSTCTSMRFQMHMHFLSKVIVKRMRFHAKVVLSTMSLLEKAHALEILYPSWYSYSHLKVSNSCVEIHHGHFKCAQTKQFLTKQKNLLQFELSGLASL